MQIKVLAGCLLASLALTVSPFAGASDDKKWVDQCVKDNKDEGAKPEVVKKYCECMNDKMSEDETKSISEWEKTHETEMKACEKESGWK